MNKIVTEEIKDLLENQNIDKKDILKLVEASEYMGVSKSFLYKLTHKGNITHFKPNGKLIYFRKSDLNAWMLQNKVSGSLELEEELDYYLKRNCHGNE